MGLFFEKMTVYYLVSKFPPFMASSYPLPYLEKLVIGPFLCGANWIQSIFLYPIFNVVFNIVLPPELMSPKLLLLFGFLLRFYKLFHLTSLSCVLHIPPISSLFVYSNNVLQRMRI